jgi:hypothetical protein
MCLVALVLVSRGQALADFSIDVGVSYNVQAQYTSPTGVVEQVRQSGTEFPTNFDVKSAMAPGTGGYAELTGTADAGWNSVRGFPEFIVGQQFDSIVGTAPGTYTGSGSTTYNFTLTATQDTTVYFGYEWFYYTGVNNGSAGASAFVPIFVGAGQEVDLAGFGQPLNIFNVVAPNGAPYGNQIGTQADFEFEVFPSTPEPASFVLVGVGMVSIGLWWMKSLRSYLAM